MKDWKRLTALAVSAIALTGVASAQQAQAPAPTAAPTGDQAVRTFDTAFFARFNPVTAEDMVRQLPGFTIDEGEELRGFGATAGNVLIDGQRPASKTEISKELGRIAARDVLRIELIGAAAAGDIDVRGYTELANVVLKPAAQVQVSTTWAATTRYYEQGPRVCRSARRAPGRAAISDSVSTCRAPISASARKWTPHSATPQAC